MSALRDAFPDGRFGEPASATDISAAEAELGVTLPNGLKELYLETNGFREPRGGAQYLSPLVELVSSTKFLWRDLPASIPGPFPDLRPFVFFGSDGIGGWWGIRIAKPHDIIYWHHHLLDGGPDFEAQPGDIIDVMKVALALYDEAEHGIA
jgi:hypothetical protein